MCSSQIVIKLNSIRWPSQGERPYKGSVKINRQQISLEHQCLRTIWNFVGVTFYYNVYAMVKMLGFKIMAD